MSKVKQYLGGYGYGKVSTLDRVELLEIEMDEERQASMSGSKGETFASLEDPSSEPDKHHDYGPGPDEFITVVCYVYVAVQGSCKVS